MPARQRGQQLDAPCAVAVAGGEKRKVESGSIHRVCHSCGWPVHRHRAADVELYHPAGPTLLAVHRTTIT